MKSHFLNRGFSEGPLNKNITKYMKIDRKDLLSTKTTKQTKKLRHFHNHNIQTMQK